MKVKKYIQSVLIILLTILGVLSIYYTIVFLIQTVQGYAKASTYYEYNLIETNQEGIGYFNDEYNEGHKLIHIQSQALPLLLGTYPTEDYQMIISQEDALSSNLNLNDEVDGYKVVGITSRNTYEQSRYVSYTTSSGLTLVDPNLDIEKMSTSFNHYQEVKDYIFTLVKVMRVLVVMSFILLIIQVFYTKHLYIKMKKLTVLMIISIIMSGILLLKINGSINQYFIFPKDLEISLSYIIYGLVSTIYLGLFTLLKKLKII